jgi:hypothetical protein
MTAMKRALVALASLLVGLGLFAAPTPASAAPKGTIHVVIGTPRGVPAAVDLLGQAQHTATKPPSGTGSKTSFSVLPGTYLVRAPGITYDGRFYQPFKLPHSVTVRPGRSTVVTAVYVGPVGARDLQATSIGTTSMGLGWTAAKASAVALRRTTGDTPVTDRTKGSPVPVQGAAALDSGLEPGTTYSYSLFTRVGRTWVGPLTMTAGTAAAADSTDAAYIAPPTTLLADPGDVVSASTTGSGVRLALAPQVPTRLLRSAVVLPQSEGLPGGFLGVVTGVSADGRTVDLAPGGITDAFDYYSLSVPEISGVMTEVGPASAPAGAPSGAGAREGEDDVPLPSERTPLPPRDATTGPARPPEKASAPDAGPSAAAAGISCAQGQGVGQKVTYSPSISLGGRFKATISKKKLLFIDVPTGASLDMAVTATVSGAAAVETTAGWSCGMDLKPTMLTLSASPVPLSFYFKPTAEFNVQAAARIENVGMTAKAGVRLSGSLSLDGNASFSGSPILEATPLTPKVAVNGSIGATVGGQVVVGPGAGSMAAGVIAGLGGQLNPLEASFGPTFSVEDSRFNACVVAEAKATVALSMTAKAWLGNWDISRTVTVDALQGSHEYGAWDLPSGCRNATPPVDPGDDVLGNGVTAVEDSTTGNPSQWGHVDGFAPGQKTWVLSTGLIGDALGTPDQVASNDLGEPGDEGLSALAGHPTFDAAAYQVTLVPTGSTLHVKYAFASEEYPEYVGSQFNDVMAVFIDGVNCASVPGTSTPVTVNTINSGSNAQYYVDNVAGAAGYSTSMDGLTVPLTCSRSVTPGQPVTVRIAVADTSDGILDSAVALIDEGIWSD